MKDQQDQGGHASIHPSSFILHPSITHVRYAVMAFLCVLSFLTYFDRVCIVRAQSDIQNDLHLSGEQEFALLPLATPRSGVRRWAGTHEVGGGARSEPSSPNAQRLTPNALPPGYQS